MIGRPRGFTVPAAVRCATCENRISATGQSPNTNPLAPNGYRSGAVTASPGIRVRKPRNKRVLSRLLDTRRSLCTPRGGLSPGLRCLWGSSAYHWDYCPATIRMWASSMPETLSSLPGVSDVCFRRKRQRGGGQHGVFMSRFVVCDHCSSEQRVNVNIVAQVFW